LNIFSSLHSISLPWRERKREMELTMDVRSKIKKLAHLGEEMMRSVLCQDREVKWVEKNDCNKRT
jgi:hypothetical protein